MRIEKIFCRQWVKEVYNIVYYSFLEFVVDIKQILIYLLFSFFFTFSLRIIIVIMLYSETSPNARSKGNAPK